MRLSRHSKFSVLLTGLIFTGCASYSPSLVRLNLSGPNVRKAVQGDLTVYVEEYVTPEKSERAFDANLVAEGVLPLLMLVENNSRQSYEVKTMDIAVRADSPLRALTPEEAAGKAGRNPVGRALGWSLIVPIISIPVAVAASAIHTSSVNKQIVQDFTAKQFPDGPIPPHRERSGFVFFELEAGRTNLTGLNLEMAAKNVATGETLKITVALPETTFAPTPPQYEDQAQGSERQSSD